MPDSINFGTAKKIREVIAYRIRKENKDKALPRAVPCSADVMDAVNTYFELKEEGKI